MKGTVGSGNRWIVVLWGGLLGTVGLVQVGATIFYLLTGEGLDGWDIGSGLLNGGYTTAVGCLLLVGHLDHQPLILPVALWRYWFVLALFLLGTVQLPVVLGEPWPQWLWETPTLTIALGTWFFFAPFNRPDSPPALPAAKQRTWRRSIIAVALAGIAVLGVVVVLAVAGAPDWAVALLPFGVVLSTFAFLMRRGLSTLSAIGAGEHRQADP